MNEQEIQKKNSMTQALSAPGAVDPRTGRLSLQAIGAVTQIDPMLGAQLGQQQETLRLRDLQINEKKQALSMRIGTSYVESYDRYLQQTGGNKEEALRKAQVDRQGIIDEMERSGALSVGGLNEQDIARLRSFSIHPDQARALVSAMGGKITEVNKGSFEQDLRAAGIQPGTPEWNAHMKKRLARETSPTMQMQMADITIPEEDKKFWAEIIRKGGSLPPGLARSAAGAKLVSEVMKEVPKGGTKPTEVLAGQAEFGGIKAGERTLGTRSANIEMAVNEADQFADLALSASNAVPRPSFMPLTKAIQAGQKSVGDPKLASFVAANNSFINAYARAISPSGVPTVSDKEHAREMISTAQSPEAYAAVIAQLKKEMAAAVRSPSIVRSSLREAVTGEKKQDLSGTWTPDKEKRYQELLRKRDAAQ